MFVFQSRSLFFMAEAKLLTVSIALTALTALAAAIGVGFWRRKTRTDEEKIRELEKSLKAALQNCSAERQGRIRAQQALRKVAKSNDSNNSYPLAPIAITRSCFSTRYLFSLLKLCFLVWFVNMDGNVNNMLWH